MSEGVDARRIALSLPETVEQDHHGRPSFRVRGKIFATLPDTTRLNVMIPFEAVDAAVGEHAGCCTELWWGRRIRGVQVELELADTDTLRELLTDAWRLKSS